MKARYLLLLLFLASCAQTQPAINLPTNSPITTQPSVTLPTTPLTTYNVELALTDAQREIGLMNRSSLPQGQGMLFVFNYDRPLSFWMKNTLIPLDILFINSTLDIVDVRHMVPCTQDPCQNYDSAGPAMYALEINANQAQTSLIGEKVAMSR